ncbi:hypothetical protein GCM10011513_03380 [Franconibacter daqui]|uniref:gp53-like domain-containing protein n=1 Tax=Franconibacter daqui TaxID=2047724 RepID=UPI0016637F7D|nr:hypothetical protein [Franconibacter daqui]GGD09198.1 hypothetical protein GCM10011513_03380 [Franconibacter daqui]
MALTLLAANNAQTVLAAGISASATTMTVNTGTGALFPSPSSGVSYFKLTLVDAATGQLTEIVHVTARTGDTMTISRGQEGTTARAWSANDIAANMMTAGTLSLLAQTALSLQIANNLSEIAAAGSAAVSAAQSNLGLGNAATKNTGNGAGQIPTMANFTSGSGWIKFPDGTIIQTGTSISGPVGFPTTITFPIPFTVSYRIATSFDTAATGAADCPAFATTPAGGGLLAFYLMSSRTSGAGAGANWIAIGK